MSNVSNPATLVKLDASGNVLSNIAAQTINPNTVATNPYALTLVSHQTGLSAAIATAAVPVNIGTSISMPKSGILKISVKGHVSSTTGSGAIDFVLTRASVAYYYGLGSTSANLSQSIFSSNTNSSESGIANTSPETLIGGSVFISNAGHMPLYDAYEILVVANDSIQFRASNTSGGTTVYIDDMVLMLQ